LSKNSAPAKGSPAALQQKVISRELKKRGEPGVAESHDLDAFPGIKFLNPKTGKMGSFYYWSSVEGKNEALSMITNKKLVAAHDDDTPMTWDEYKQALDDGYRGVAAGLKEFAPPGGGGGDDGNLPEILRQLAAQWWNGDEDPRAERTLAAMGWEIGQDEGYDNGGVFVVRAGDEHGKSYVSWPAEDLEGLSEGNDDKIAGRYDPEVRAQMKRMAAKEGVAEDSKKGTNPRVERILRMLRARHPQAENDLEALIFDFRDQQRQDRTDIARLDAENDMEEASIEKLEQMLDALKHRRELAASNAMESKQHAIEEKLSRQMAAEDVLGAVKRRLDDYLLQQQQRALRHAEKMPQPVAPQDILGDPVKKIDLGNGKVLTIRGNEDDGFRIHLGQKCMPTQFATLEEAELAMHIYEARKQTNHLVNETTAGAVAAVAMPMGTTIKRELDEKKDACYNKVRSRYKVWPSAYASGALVQCRKKGADNWGNKS
jgi:hypothetical protein